MKVAMRGVMYDDRDIVRGKALAAEFKRLGIQYVTEHRQDNSSFMILVPDNVPLTSDVYP